MQRRELVTLSLALVVWLGSAGASEAETTLWKFLGVPQAMKAIFKPINTPENLESNNPAIKKAAEVKQEEDKKRQKKKALRHLAKTGCGCYPGVKEAMMDALDDCTEAVRLSAARQIAKSAEHKCETCQKTCCCDEEMTKKLAEIAYERDETGCFIEPSERVREAAAEAMRACCQANANQRRGGSPISMEPIQATRQQEEIEKPAPQNDIERPTDPGYDDPAPKPDGEARRGSAVRRAVATEVAADDTPWGLLPELKRRTQGNRFSHLDSPAESEHALGDPRAKQTSQGQPARTKQIAETGLPPESRGSKVRPKTPSIVIRHTKPAAVKTARAANGNTVN